MPYDDMDRFVAFSKCLTGIGTDRVVDDHRYSELATKIIKHMNQLLDDMDTSEPKNVGEDASNLVAKQGSGVEAAVVGVAARKNAPPVVLRDDLFSTCRMVLQNLERGVSFETITKAQLDDLMRLAHKATVLHDAIERYQQNRG